MARTRIQVPFSFKPLANSYRWGFQDAERGRNERTAAQIGTPAAAEAYAAGYQAGTEKRERRTTLSLAGAATSALRKSAALSTIKKESP